MCRFKIGVLVMAMVCLQVCSAISLIKDQSLVKRNAFLGTGDTVTTGRLLVKRFDTSGLVNKGGNNNKKSIQKEVEVFRRNPLPADGAVKDVGAAAQATISTVFRRDPFDANGRAENKLKQKERMNDLAVVRRDPFLGAADGVPSAVNLAQPLLSMGRRSLANTAQVDNLQGTSQQDNLNKFSKIQARDISGEAQASITSTGLTENVKKAFDRVTSSGPQLRKRINDDMKLGAELHRRDVQGDLKLGVKLDKRDVKGDLKLASKVDKKDAKGDLNVSLHTPVIL